MKKNIVKIILLNSLWWLTGVVIFSSSIYTFQSVSHLSNAFLLGIVIYLLSRNFLNSFLICLAVEVTAGLFLFAEPVSFSIFIIRILLNGIGIAVSIFAERYLVSRKVLVLICLILLIVNFSISSFTYQPKAILVASIEPPSKSYTFDGFQFLKVFYLMKHGMGYYASFYQSYMDRANSVPDPLFMKSVLAWRLPTIYWIWKNSLPANGAYILVSFIVFSIINLVLAFYIVNKATNYVYGLASVVLLFPYFLMPVVKFWFLSTEYWAVFFMFFSAALYINKKLNLSFLFALLSAAIREFFVIFFIGMFLCSLIAKNKRETLIWGSGILFFAGIYLLHYIKLKPYLSALSAGIWITPGIINKVENFMNTLSFGTYFYLQKTVIVAIGSLISLFNLILIKEKKVFDLFISLVVLPALIIFLLGATRDYWGIIYMPFVLLFLPVGLFKLEEKLRFNLKTSAL